MPHSNAQKIMIDLQEVLKTLLIDTQKHRVQLFSNTGLGTKGLTSVKTLKIPVGQFDFEEYNLQLY